MPNMPGFPGKDYLNYEALEAIAIEELKLMQPRVRAEVIVNGQPITSLEQLEQMNSPYEFEVIFPEPIIATSDLSEATESLLGSAGTSVDDGAVIWEHGKQEVQDTYLAQIDYDKLVLQISNFVTTAIRLWQTNGGTELIKVGAPDTQAKIGVSAISYTKGELISIDDIDEDNTHDTFDPKKIQDLITSPDPYISEDDLGNLYTENPDQSPDGINLFTIKGIVTPNTVYAYGYCYPQEVNIPEGIKQFTEKITYNNIRFLCANQSLFKILVAYMLRGAPSVGNPSLLFEE